MLLSKKIGQIKMKLIDKIKSNNKSGKISFVSYITAGDPDIKTSLNIMKKLAENGTDIIELGVPFSDPISDGPTIQKATERALSNKVDMKTVLDLVKKFRKNYSTPIVIFGYYNPFLKFGLNKIMKNIKDAGADGVLVVDLPPEEAEEIQEAVNKQNLELVYLVAPTSTNKRIQTIAKLSNSFIYLVSVTGVTGTRTTLDSNLAPFIKRLKKQTKRPICVGFGISTPKHVLELKKNVDGIVIGSAIIKIIEENLKNKKEIIKKISKFSKKISEATKI
tara:strand:- start:4794 stop:5624 length:831 start_codon:yes stop_codon:yes gene_type:complete